MYFKTAQFLVWKNVEQNYKRYMSTYKFRFIIENVREIRTTLKNHYALWCHKCDICILFKAKFLKKEAK